MDSQIVFNSVTDHLARQKIPAMDQTRFTGCMLRGYKGTKCAIGCLIPDSVYVASMENDSGISSSIDSISSDGSMHAWLLHTLAPTREQYALLGKLQICHDMPTLDDDPPETARDTWPMQLARIAKDFGLEFDQVSFKKNLNNPEYV